MKTPHIKLVLVLCLIFCAYAGYAPQAQEQIMNESVEVQIQKKAEFTHGTMKPRWVCPHVDLGMNYSLHISMFNFGMQTVKIRFIFYDYAGNVAKTDEHELGPKESFYAGYYRDRYLPPSFVGAIEIQATSPAVFPSAWVSEDVSDTRTIQTPVDWYSVE